VSIAQEPPRRLPVGRAPGQRSGYRSPVPRRRERLRPAGRRQLTLVYQRLLGVRGPAGWWPGETPFEVCVGAILTQNTAWTNVEKALTALRSRGLLSFAALRRLPPSRIAPLIRSSGYFNVKAKRLASFLKFLEREYAGAVERMAREDPWLLRARLLAVDGIGRETADSIVLYAAGLPLFVVDAYTRRIFARLGFLQGDEAYDDVQRFFMRRLPEDVPLYNDYHAQIVLLGKDVCRSRPLCETCPLLDLCPRRGVAGERGRRAPRPVTGPARKAKRPAAPKASPAAREA
jgi:endonuclease-3 related protein